MIDFVNFYFQNPTLNWGWLILKCWWSCSGKLEFTNLHQFQVWNSQSVIFTLRCDLQILVTRISCSHTAVFWESCKYCSSVFTLRCDITSLHLKPWSLLPRWVVIITFYLDYPFSVFTLRGDNQIISYVSIPPAFTRWWVVKVKSSLITQRCDLSVSIWSLSLHWDVIIRVYVYILSLASHWGVIIRAYVRIPSLPSHWGVIFRVYMSISSLCSLCSVIFRVHLRIPYLSSHWGVIFRVYLSILSLLSHWGVLFRSLCEPPSLSSLLIVSSLMRLLVFLGVSQ